MTEIKKRMTKFYDNTKVIKEDVQTCDHINIHQVQREYEMFQTFHAIKIDVEQMNAAYHKQCYYVEVKQCKCISFEPQAREGAFMIKNPMTKKVFLYGGVNHEPM